MEGLGVTPRRVVLTGAAGFIGSHVARALVAAGHDVTAILRPETDRWRLADLERRLSIVAGDLSEVDAIAGQLRARGADVCIHLAWRGWPGAADANANLRSLTASLDLLRQMAEIGCRRFVAAGTCVEYELTGAVLRETSRLVPHELYGTCKKALFEVAQQYAVTTGLSVVTPRIFYVYGPHEDARRLVPSIARALLRGEAAGVTRGGQVRDYLHVADVASAICAVALGEVTGAVNIASGRAVTVAQIATRIGELLDRSDLVRLGALPYRAGESMHIVGDATVLRDRLGWQPEFDLDRGLADTVTWWQTQLELAATNGAR